MEHIETIEIRLAQAIHRKLETELAQIIREVNKEESGIRIKFYNKIKLSKDYLIIITYQKKNPDSNGKSLGLRIKAAFREYGLVNLTEWNELENDTQVEL